jgi:hypothetical protein
MTSIPSQMHQTQHPDVPFALYQKAQRRIEHLEEENRQLKQELCWRDQLDRVPASIISVSQKATLRATILHLKGKEPDEQNFFKIEPWKIGRLAGQSDQTVRENLTYCSEHVPLFRKKLKRVVDTEKPQGFRLETYLCPTELLPHPHQYQVAVPRNHGGKRITCPHCGSDKLQRRVSIYCTSCGELIGETKLSNVNPDTSQEHKAHCQLERQAAPTDEKKSDAFDINLTEEEPITLQSQLDSLPKPATPPQQEEPITLQSQLDSLPKPAVLPEQEEPITPQSQLDSLPKPATPPQQEEDTPTGSPALLQQAVELLVAVAGDFHEHIVMNSDPDVPKKYTTIHRPLHRGDVMAHLKGARTVGASLASRDGTTRALCFDADHEEGWLLLREAALILEAAQFKPLLEVSPAGRGGHLWLIFSSPVRADAAYRSVCCLAPQLRTIKEYWPGATHQKVRLLAGRYVTPNFSAWCSLSTASGQLLARTGEEAVSVLLSSLTPSDLLPPVQEGPPVPPDRKQDGPPARKQERQGAHGVDEYHQQKYQASTMWIHFTPAQLARWYNAQTSVYDLLPAEKNGMGLASWRGERTASVAFRGDEAWVDFGAGARRADGKQDGGDALELAVRLTEQQKREFLRTVGKELNRAASQEILRAAREGVAPASWVAELMTQEGWRVYHENAPLGGLAGFSRVEECAEREKASPAVASAPAWGWPLCAGGGKLKGESGLAAVCSCCGKPACWYSSGGTPLCEEHWRRERDQRIASGEWWLSLIE